jgi:uncharacterized membrane protein (DUF4010 family)
VSSTAVALTFSRRSREEPALAAPLALGVVAACTVLIPRLLVISAMLRPAVAVAALPILAPVFLAGAAVVGVAIWRERDTRPTTDGEASDIASPPAAAAVVSPLGLGSALQMAAAFQLVLFAIAWVELHSGRAGVLTSAAVLGLTDMDALTVSMARLGADAALVRMAAAAIGIGVLANTALKLGLVLAFGTPRFRLRAGAGLLTIALGSAIGLAIGWP